MESGEKGVRMPIIMIAKSILGPCIWSFHANSGCVFDIRFPKIWDPSSGAMGIKLNIARAMFMEINKYIAWISSWLPLMLT